MEAMVFYGIIMGLAIGVALSLYLKNRQHNTSTAQATSKKMDHSTTFFSLPHNVPKTSFYIRKIKATDCRMDFDPFDNPFGGGTPISYPQFGPNRVLYTSMTQTKIVCRYGIFKHNDKIKDLCYAYGPSKQELELTLEKYN